MINNIEEKFRKCFELAVQGETLAFPNPNVACLIYHKEKLISSGIHRNCGEAHAEVIAINKAKDFYSGSPELQKSYESFQDFAASCDLIVNLEPCSHFGQTPPCTLLIQNSGFKTIAFAAYDTNPEVHRKSLEIFADSSYNLIKPEDLSDEIQKEALFVNRVFFSIKKKEQEKKLPVYLTVKIASYPDGDMITKEADEWITCKEARKDVHRLRSANQILISSSSTIEADDPSYNVRHSGSDLNLLDTRDPDILVLFNKNQQELKDIESERKVIYERINDLNKESLEAIIEKLSFLGYQKIMVEAGPSLSHAFLGSDLIDELVIYQSIENRDESEFIKDLNSEFKSQNLNIRKISKHGASFKSISSIQY